MKLHTIPYTKDALHEAKIHFHATGNIPGIVHAVDGTLILRNTPSLLNPFSICDKAFLMLSMQVIYSNLGIFTDIMFRE